MKLLVIFKAAARAGVRPAATRRTVVADWVRVGRDAACEIHLPDPRIALNQAMIVHREGLVYIEGESGGQNITRKAVRSIRLKPGEPVEIGPYRLAALAAPAGYDGAVEVEQVHASDLPAGLASRTSHLTLASVGLSRRWMAWALGLAVAIAFFALPAARVFDFPWKIAAERLGLFDRVWNPGPLMLAHQPIESRCSACHEVAFEHVKDTACLECHRNVGQHVGPEMKPAALFAGARCASCHRDHKGEKPTYRDDDAFCVACHRDLKARASAATSANASDFARDHPRFRLTLEEEDRVRRVRMGPGATIRQEPHLAFPHSVHLEAKGVKSPTRGRVRLECGACHQPDASRRAFEPISMAAHCQECHRLEFEPAVTTREVPHGDPRAAATVVEEFYASLALKGVPDSFQKAFGVPGEGLLRRVGEASAGERRDALRLASRKAGAVAAELFEVRVCKTCHEVRREVAAGGTTWQVAEVHLIRQWMPHARFDHRAHAQARCEECHDVARSKRSSDVSMPSIERCRECHGGSRPVADKVTSNCLLCHGFHQEEHPWDPSFKPRQAPRLAGEPPHAR